MIENLDLRVDPRTAHEKLLLTAAISTQLGIDANRIKHITVTRRSIDARQRRVMVNLSVAVYIDNMPENVSLIQPVHIPAALPAFLTAHSEPVPSFSPLRL